MHQMFTISPPECIVTFPFKVPTTLHDALVHNVSFNLTAPFFFDLIKLLHGKILSTAFKAEFLKSNSKLFKKSNDYLIRYSLDDTNNSKRIEFFIEKYTHVINFLEEFAPFFFPKNLLNLMI